jgi:hypothetical protein
VAKTRSRSGSRKASSSRRKVAGRGARKAIRTRKPKVALKHIELRPIRRRLQTDIGRLGTAISVAREPKPELEEALKRMSRWLDDIQDICGPDMLIPLP